MISERPELLAGLTLNPPASPQVVDKLAASVASGLPEDYLGFLRFANGCEGFVGEGGHLELFKAEELVEANERYGMEEFFPGFFLIGTNGGGEAFVYDVRTDKRPIYMVPFIVMDEDALILCGHDLETFFEFVSKQTD